MTVVLMAVLPNGHGPAPSWLDSAYAHPNLQSLTCGNATVWMTKGAPYTQLTDSCTVFGRLFRRTDHRRADTASSEVTGGLDEVLRAYWGAYLALETHGETTHVLRDPSGQLPCYYYYRDGIVILFNDLDTVVRFGWLTPMPDREGICHHLTFPGFPLPTTCLAGVCELLPGMSLGINAHGAHTKIRWSPWSFTRKGNRIANLTEATERLRTVLADCVSTWGSLSQRGLLQLSGGLDSSVVGLCLRPENVMLACTLVPPGDGCDEQVYAEKIANLMNVYHKILDFNPEINDLTPLTTLAPRPVDGVLHSLADRWFLSEGDDYAIDGFYNGNGGDSVFCKLNTAGPVSDAFMTLGFSRETAMATLDLADIYGVTIWDVAYLALKKALRRSRLMAPTTEGLSAAATRLRLKNHPWQKGMPSHLPGKIDHVRGVLGSLRPSPAIRTDAAPEIFQPLMSQPIIETCLRIPTWLWIRGGRDRAVVREAFGAQLPPSIHARRTKGDFSTVNAAIAERLYSQVRSLLLEGWLMRQNIVDRPEIERRLSLTVAEQGRHFHRLLQLAQTELWVRAVLAKGSGL